MSSHHFVRDGQEPALFILDPLLPAIARSLLEWAPYVVVTSAALDLVLSHGIKVDMVLTPKEEQDIVLKKIAGQMPVEIVAYENKASAITAGLKQLTGHQHTVHIITRDPEKMFDEAVFFLNDIRLVLLNDNIRWLPSKHFSKWLPAGSRIIVSKKAGHQLQYDGLHELENGVYACHSDQQINLRSNNLFWIGEPFIDF